MWFFIFYRARCVYRVFVLSFPSNWTLSGDRQDGAKLLVRFTVPWPCSSSDSDYGCVYDVGCTPMGGSRSWAWTWRGVSSLIVVCCRIEDILKHTTEMNFGGMLSCTIAFGVELSVPTPFKADLSCETPYPITSVHVQDYLAPFQHIFHTRRYLTCYVDYLKLSGQNLQ